MEAYWMEPTEDIEELLGMKIWGCSNCYCSVNSPYFMECPQCGAEMHRENPEDEREFQAQRRLAKFLNKKK